MSVVNVSYQVQRKLVLQSEPWVQLEFLAVLSVYWLTKYAHKLLLQLP